MNNVQVTRIHADAELLGFLRQLGSIGDQSSADLLLARVVWARITEPGDAVAGAVVNQLGALAALELVAAGVTGRRFEGTLRDSGSDDPPSHRRLAAALDRWRPRLDRAATVADLTTAVSVGMTLLTPESPGWPSGLSDLDEHAPHVLWVRGKFEFLRTASLAVVGARACTGYGSHVTAELTSEACTAGFTVVSGAAYGVDAVAHRTALALEAPTVAVLAGGVDRAYPAAHAQLLARISEHGAVCSEMIPGSAPTRWRFLQRNRLIAALSQAVLVTEAGVRSGTLNTAGHGAELGRAIGAVPGAITSVTSAGCHRLIRDYGAALITNRMDLLELLGVSDTILDVQGEESEMSNSSRQPSLHVRLLDALPLTGGKTLEEVARIAGVSLAEAREALTELELLRFVAQKTSVGEGPPLWVMLRRK